MASVGNNFEKFRENQLTKFT